MRKFFCLLFLFIFSFIPHSSFHIINSLYAEPTNYTYNYDYWYEYSASPDAYRVGAYILGTALGIGHFREPQGLFIRDNRIYICDSGNNRIVVIEEGDSGVYTVVNVVTSVFVNGEESKLAYPMDIFVSKDDFIYIADTNNNRIIKLDSDWNHVLSITRPDDDSLDDFVEFHPMKLVVDFANRIFTQVRNVNKGFMEFDSRGDFSGYMGANEVVYNIIDYIWRFFSTQEQRSQRQLFVPTEYNNLAIDSDGFIYATSYMTANQSGNLKAVKRLNAMGQDILVRNGYEDPVGDIVFTDVAYGGVSGFSRLIDVVAFDNDSYACFDRARGRIFMYDFQGNLLYAFGGLGNREGYFLMPAAIDRMGDTLYALDSRTAAVTRLDLTTYGELINLALNEYKAGRYESSAEVWEEVLKMNGNCDFAYIGIGRAALRQGDYLKAMEYYKLKHYRVGYGKAFQLYRKQWMEENLWWILLGIVLLIFVPIIVKFTVKTVKEIREA